MFAELIELTSEAQFELKERRVEIIGKAVTKNDTLKFMLYALSELKGIEEPKFISLSLKLEEVGRMLYGWKNQTQSQQFHIDYADRDSCDLMTLTMTVGCRTPLAL